MHTLSFLYTFVENLYNMLLCFLLSICSATFTVADKNTVSPTGNLPEGSGFSYSRTITTGTKGQMTAGSSTTLCLTGWGGCTVQSVTLSMRSNSASGAGSLLMTIGNSPVWDIPDAPFASAEWNGAYSSSFVDISHDLSCTVTGNDDIQIRISASQNSLYINSYTISYTPAVPQSYRVSFVSGLGHNPPSVTESAPYAGIVLPCLTDTAQWHFVGWSETEADEASPCPSLFPARSRYYPRHHSTLWAVYLDTTTISRQLTLPQSGRYALVSNSPYWGPNALTGEISTMPSGIESTTPVVETLPVLLDTTPSHTLVLLSEVYPDMVYSIALLSDSTLTVTHETSRTGIGYMGNRLFARPSTWRFRLLDDHSLLLYYPFQSNHYLLFVAPLADSPSDAVVAYTSPFIFSASLPSNGITLFPVTSCIYTTWPFGKVDAVSNITADTPSQDMVIPFGIYRLRIRNGRKYLHLVDRQ